MPTIKGTSSVIDDHAMKKMLKQTKFPPIFSQKINLEKINRPVLSQWIEKRICELLEFEDEIVVSTAINLFLPSNSSDGGPSITSDIDPKRCQLDLIGFLGKENAARFVGELWPLMVDASKSATGIPSLLLEEKKKELERKQEEERRMQHQQQRYAGDHQYQQGVVNPQMNQIIQDAARRAEAARQALGVSRGDDDGNAVLPRLPVPVPVPVSPPHNSPQQYHKSEHEAKVKKGNGSGQLNEDRKRRHTSDNIEHNRFSNESDGRLDDFGRKRGVSRDRYSNKPSSRWDIGRETKENSVKGDENCNRRRRHYEENLDEKKSYDSDKEHQRRRKEAKRDTPRRRDRYYSSDDDDRQYERRYYSDSDDERDRRRERKRRKHHYHHDRDDDRYRSRRRSRDVDRHHRRKRDGRDRYHRRELKSRDYHGGRNQQYNSD